MKQETLEEAAKEFYPPTTTDLICSPKLVRDAFIAGANYQAERMYSEEEVLEILFELSCNNDTDKEEVEEWFEQFKKK
jgi:hypothetical protein